MSSLSAFRLFVNHCGGCDKRIDSYAIGRSGQLPQVFCDRVCETTYRNKKRFDQKPITHDYDKFFSERKPFTLPSSGKYNITTGKEI